MPYEPKRLELFPEAEHEWIQWDTEQERIERKLLLLYQWAKLVFDSWIAKPAQGAIPGTLPGTWTGPTTMVVRKGVPKELAVQIRLGYRVYKHWAGQYLKKEQATADFQKALHLRMQEYHYLRTQLEPYVEKSGRVMKSMPARTMARVPQKGVADAVSSAKSEVKGAFKAAGQAASSAAHGAFQTALPFLLIAGLFWIWTQKPAPAPKLEKAT